MSAPTVYFHCGDQGHPLRHVVDITVALLSADLFLVMTRECAWTTKQWENRVTGQLAHALLQAP